LALDNNIFSPNVYVNIEKYLDKKMQAMEIYDSEISVFPFPRSRESLLHLARFRGTSSEFFAAEAFELLLEREI